MYLNDVEARCGWPPTENAEKECLPWVVNSQSLKWPLHSQKGLLYSESLSVGRERFPMPSAFPDHAEAQPAGFFT